MLSDILLKGRDGFPFQGIIRTMGLSTRQEDALRALMYEGHYPKYWGQNDSVYSNTWVKLKDLHPDNERIVREEIGRAGYYLINTISGRIEGSSDKAYALLMYGNTTVWVSLRNNDKQGDMECMRREQPYLSSL